jgi:hypothetical protein
MNSGWENGERLLSGKGDMTLLVVALAGDPTDTVMGSL